MDGRTYHGARYSGGVLRKVWVREADGSERWLRPVPPHVGVRYDWGAGADAQGRAALARAILMDVGGGSEWRAGEMMVEWFLWHAGDGWMIDGDTLAKAFAPAAMSA